ncbi:MAG: PAS domain S-box protein, partial [Methanogenium sp.]|nr:PAS domain S-box protein [Methanogenium sp.]
GIYDFDDAVNSALADMGQMSRADRDYLFLVREGGVVADNTHEWCAKGVSPQIDNLQNIPLEMFPWWREKICNREIIHITDVSKLPPEAEAEREGLEMQNIRSLIVLPVFCGDEPAGFLGFDSIRETGEWSEEVILILRTVAEIIGKSLELKRMQDAIRESEEKFRALAENSPDTIMRFDRHCRHLYVNSVVEQQTNIPAEEFIGKTHSELDFPNDLVELWEGAIQEVFATKKKNSIEFKLPAGIWIEWLLVPEFSSDGEVKVVIAAGRDITELKRMQGVLEESEERFRLLAASTPVAVLLYQDNRFVYANPAAEEISGYSEAELCQMNFLDTVHPDYVDLIKERVRARQRDEITVNRYEFK